MKYEIAVLCDTSGKVVGALKCKMVDEHEYKELIEKAKRNLEIENHKLLTLNQKLENALRDIKTLQKEIKVLKGEE